MGRVVCIHHNDLDGRCAAAIVIKKFPEALCLETNYDQVFPVNLCQKNDTVYMVDFTPDKLADFQRLLEITDDVHWIDHHGKNIAEYPFYNKALKGTRVESKPSGAMLTWEYLFPHIDAPKAVAHTSDYDCWIWAFGKLTKLFEAGINTIPHYPHDKLWIDLLSTDLVTEGKIFNEIIQRGEIVIEYRNQLYSDIVQTIAFECELDEYTVIACNCPNVGSSLFDSINSSNYDIMSTFRSNGESVVISLYSEHPHIDCGDLAKKYGGGGHKGAAGFECKDVPYTNIKPINDNN